MGDERYPYLIRVRLSSVLDKNNRLLKYSVDCMDYSSRSGFCAGKESLEEIAEHIKKESDAARHPFYLVRTHKGYSPLSFFERLFRAERKHTTEASQEDVDELTSFL